MTRRHAEIVGAGFAGLAAACALAQRGWSVRVHERADRLRTTGAGIYIYENGLRVLETLGAYDAAVKGAPFAHTREVRDDRNRTISVHRWQGNTRVYSIVRQTVVEALAEQARKAGAEIVFNSVGMSVTPAGDLTLADGGTLKADLVVAADGTGSRLRDGLGLVARRKYLPDGCTRLLIEKIPEERGQESKDNGATTVEYWSGSRRVLYTPCSETEVYIALTMLDTDAVAKATPVDREAWTRWFPHLSSLIARLGEGRYDRFEYIRLKRWSSGRGGGDRRRRPRAAAEHRPGRRLRHDERAGDGGLSRPRAGRAFGARRLGEQRARHHRAHPAHFSDARLADHLAAVSARQGAGACRQMEVAGAPAHQDRAAPADGDVSRSRCSD